MAFKIEGKKCSPSLVWQVLLVSSLLSGLASMCTTNREKPFPHKLSSFMSSLCACPASSASTECIFPTYDLLWSKIRKSLDAQKAENWLKYTYCAKLKITVGIYSNCLIFILFFSRSFEFRCCLFCLIKKILQLTVQVSCLFYFLLSRFFKGKVKSGFYWVF